MTEAKGKADRFRGLLGMNPREFSKEELAERNLKLRLRDHPEIEHLLAIGEDAQRVVQSTLRSRTDVIGFGTVGALKRSIQRSAPIDLSGFGDRLVDHTYSYEAIATAAPIAPSTSSKISEYMATGLPIVAVIPKQHDSHLVLSGYPRAHIVDLADPDSWAQTFVSAWEESQSGDAHRQSHAQRYAAPHRRDLALEAPVRNVVRAATDPS